MDGEEGGEGREGVESKESKKGKGTGGWKVWWYELLWASLYIADYQVSALEQLR
jgi:hypothetical protein